jgi:signal transduction histidine kinase
MRRAADGEARGRLELERVPSRQLQKAIGVAAIAAACLSFAVLVTSESLRYPGWSAVHEANLILVPVAVGLYWWRRRPASRLGLLLVALGFLAVPVMLQGAGNPQLHSIGVLADAPGFAMTLYILLAFPTGRLRGGADRAIVAATALLLLATFVPMLFMLEHVSGGGPLAACSDQCPQNAWFVAAHPDLTSALNRIEGYGLVVLALATAVVLASRYQNGNRPQRRALAIGVSTGAVFCLAFAAFHLMLLWSPQHPYLSGALQWTLVGARAGLAWGMLFALVAAELDGGRVLRRLVAGSLRKSATRELERNLASALNDPALRLAFWQPDRGMYVDADGLEVTAPGPDSGRALTEVRRHGQRAAAILHDEQLREGPELVQAAGAAALLVYENARLEDDLRDVIADLTDSRARLAAASDTERRRLERNLHDGAQQRFIALRMKLATVQEQAQESTLRRRLGELDDDLAGALDSLRELAQGIYPALLADEGLGAALMAVGDDTDSPVRVSAKVGRFPTAIESAMYYCALEALQNARKHAGPLADPMVLVEERDGGLELTVRDQGHGFDESTAKPGDGLRNMKDRIGAIGGELVVESSPGRGTVVHARIPYAAMAELRSPSAPQPARPETPVGSVGQTGKSDQVGLL